MGKGPMAGGAEWRHRQEAFVIWREALEEKRDEKGQETEGQEPGHGDLLGHRKTKFAFSSKSIGVPPTLQY